MKISIASDHGGVSLKTAITGALKADGIEVRDFGTNSEESCDYPDYALRAAESVASGGADLGILLCKSGIGMSIAANKVPGIRAALCRDESDAKLSREHNDANMLALPGEMPEEKAVKIVRAWIEAGISSPGPEARHRRRVEKINEIERKYSCTPGVG